MSEGSGGQYPGKRREEDTMNEMTDKQMEILLTLVADKFAGCHNMEEVEKAIREVREMAKKEKPTE